MKKSTHILIVEDIAADAELAQHVIRKELKDCDFQVVETRKDFLKALETFQPDVILSDYALPSFDGITALKLTLKHAPLTPLIIWTGSSSEDVAVDCMKAGANNYVLKDNLKRLGPAILRALEEKALLFASKQAEEALQANEKRFRALIENSLDNISLLSADGTLLWESPSSIRTLNYAPNEHLGLSIFDALMHPDDLQWTRDLFTKLVQEPGSRNHTLFRLRHADGTWHWVEAIVTNMLDEPGIHAIVANYRDVNEQKRTEEALRESQIKYQNLVETSHDLIWSIDAEGYFTFVNGAAREIYGYEPQELLGRSFFEIMDPEHYQQKDFDKFSESIAGTSELREFETYVRHRDGRPFVLSANSVVLRENGNVIGVTGSSRDISLRKQEEARLNDLLAFNEKILNHSSVGILTFRATGQCVFANEKAASIVGGSLPQLLTQNFRAIPAWRKSGLYDLAEKAITTQAPTTADIHHVSTFGKDVWMTVHCVTFKAKGEDHLLLSISDITERKQAEEALRESENRLIMALSGAQMSVWEWDLQNNHILWSPEFFELTGINEDGFGETFEAFTDLVHADDVERLLVAAEKAVAEKTLFAEEFRITRPDGETRWLSNLGHAEYDSTRDHLRLIGTVQDITQRKQAEIERQALLEIMQGLTNTRDLHELLGLIHRSIANVIYGRNFFVVLYEESTGLFEEIYSMDQYDLPEPPSKLEKSITSYVFRSGKPLLLTQALFDELEAQGEVELVGTNSASWLGVPLKTSGRTIGVMAVQDYENTNRYSERDQDFLTSIATQVALAIEHREAGVALKESEEHYRAIFEGVQDAIFVESLDGRILMVNQRACEMFGYRREEFLTKTVADLVPEGYQTVRADDDSLLSAEPRKSANRRANGEIFPIEISGRLQVINGENVLLVVVRDITERKKAEESLQESEERFSSAFEYASIGMALVSLEGHWLRVNWALCQLLGYTKEELSQKTFQEISYPDDLAKDLGYVHQVLAGAIDSYQMEKRYLHKSGHVIWVLLSVSSVRDYEGRPLYFISQIQDITERKRAEAAEREQRALAEALLDTAEILNSTLDYGEVLDHILAAVGRVVPHDAATIMLIDGEVARVVRSQGYEERGFKNDVMQIALPLAEATNLRQMLETGQPVVVSDTGSYPGWKRLKTTDWLCSNVGAPISINGEVIGFILLDGATRGFFTAVHAQRLEAFASQAALAIHHAHLLQQAQEEIAERKRAEQEMLRETEMRVALLETTRDLVIERNLSSLLHTIVERAARLLHAEAGGLYLCEPELGQVKCLVSYNIPHDLTGITLKYGEGAAGLVAQTGEPLVIDNYSAWEGRAKVYDNQDYFRGLLTAAIKWQDQVIGVIDILEFRDERHFTEDELNILISFANQAAIAIHNARLLQQAQEEIAERKQAEESLRSERRKAEKYLEVAGVMMLVLDTQGTVTLINQKGCEILGYSSDEIIGKNWIDTFLPEASREELQEVFHKLISDDIQSLAYYENSILTKNGEERLVAWHNALLRDEQGRIISSLSSGEDITERKWAEEELRISEERFRQLADNIQEVFWMTDAESGEEIYISPAAEKIWEQPMERLMQEPYAFLKSIFPEDQPLVLRNIERERNGEEVEMEYRVIRPDGSLRWVWDRAFPIFDSSGKVQRIAGITADITERTEAAEKLRESEDRYHSLFQNQVHGAALHEIITNDQGQPVDYRFLKVNPAFEKMTGLNAEELVGHRVTEVLPGIENDKFIQIYGQVALTGEPIHISEYATPLRKYYEINAYSTGPRQFAVSFMDITERRESEMALVKSQSRYRELFDSSPISIWEEDFSLVKKRVDSLLESGVTDFRQFLYDHPEMIHELASLVKIIDVNQASLELYGVDRKEDLLTSLSDFMDQASTQHFEEEIIGLVSPLKRFTWEGTDVTRDGRRIEVLINGSVPHGYEEDWSKLIVSVIDITDRKRAEEEIRRRAEETSALLETSLALTNLDLKVTLHTISQSAKNLFAADGCRIFLMEPNGEELRCVLALQENTAAFTNLKVKIGEGVTGMVAASGRGEIVNEMQNDPRSIQVPGTLEEDEAIMFAPLKERDQTVGVLSIRRAGSSRPFQTADLELLEALASMAASAVSNARLYEEAQRRLTELEALYENGLAVGRLLKPNRIGERVISTIARYLQWHHVTIRLRWEESDDLELVAFSLPDLKEEERAHTEQHFVALVNKVGQGLSGWVIQTGLPFRTGNVHTHPQYVDTHAGIQSGLYMPLKVGERVIGVISVESETPDAFTEQDERLLATLGNQIATAFENARLYHAIERELSERKRTEEALRSSEVHYRELADSITDILFELDEDLCYTHWNKASEMFSGISAEDAIGKSMKEVFGTGEEQSRREEIYRSVLQEQQARTFEIEVLAKGQKRALEINAYPSAHGISVVAKDVTDRKRSETIMQKRFELMEYAAHYSLGELMQRTVDEVSELTESTIGFFHFVEEDQNSLGMQTWSTNALRLFAVPVSEGTHRGLDRAGVWAEAVRQRRPLIQNDYESLAEKKGLPKGHVPLLREIVIPILRNEKVMAVMGIGNKPRDYTLHDLEIAERLADYAWDITERKQMQDALENERNQLAEHVEERTADLSRANSNLARALRVKDEFLANMSHELRTPLNAILGLSESLGEQIAGPLNEKQQKYITTISESGHHLLSLINDILDLAKIEAGQITLDINKMDIHSVCQASLRMIKQLAQKKNQEVLLEIEGNLGWMWADERRLKQMIVNLLSNAVKFTPEDGKLGLQVHGDQDANKITITVWDNGIGIKEDDLTRLFQPFIQLDSGLAREATGTGLGLALVAQMARLHGGSVSAMSGPGKGSRFSIVLPWEPALAIDTASRLRTTSKFRAIRPDETNKPTILLVEDTKEVVMMVKDYLELAGYKVVTAQDGVDALVQARHARPDLILMDVQMPRMDGLEATRKLRSEPNFKSTPIIALTALAMPSDRERCLAAGMDEYVSKPINLKALIRIIQGCLFDRAESKPG